MWEVMKVDKAFLDAQFKGNASFSPVLELCQGGGILFSCWTGWLDLASGQCAMCQPYAVLAVQALAPTPPPHPFPTWHHMLRHIIQWVYLVTEFHPSLARTFPGNGDNNDDDGGIGNELLL